MARLTRIVTRTGDKGQTGLADGSRVDKDSLRIQALGDLDELNAALGLLAVELDDPPMKRQITDIQHRLFDLGGELALPGSTVISENQVLFLEQYLDAINEKLPPLREFVLPGSTRATAQAHIPRHLPPGRAQPVATFPRRNGKLRIPEVSQPLVRPAVRPGAPSCPAGIG